ncbi:hypothetical protein [Kiloniella majae]|uniref:hypothetical protein n=1 Tax=Kiloniella majae TaxID=1938558 RepID=UPI000F7810B8|nr:hypothetical protein [Kiloniella majae]
MVPWLFSPHLDIGPIIISGNLYHFQENRENYGLPIWNDKKSSIRSFVRIDNILDRTGATLWIEHDKPQCDSLKKITTVLPIELKRKLPIRKFPEQNSMSGNYLPL